MLWVRRSTAERPSPLRFCSDLSSNLLNGSVPSSLSALTKLTLLCVAPSCQRRLRVRPRRVGSVGSAPSARHVGGFMTGASSRGGAAAGLLRCSQRGPRARDVTEEYSKGHPLLWLQCAGTVGAHRCCGCGVAPPERPSSLRVCRYLSVNKLTGSVPSSLTNLVNLCVPHFLPTGFARAAEEGRIGRLCSEPRGISGRTRGMHVGGIEPGGAAAGLLRCSQRGPLARDVTEEYSRGTPPYGYSARVPVGAHQCCGCGVAPPSGRVRFGCADSSTTIS